ncbi:hypothetical protein AB0L74_33115 [Streptomyces sp. NPDC052020]|uniref:hypothetical protein n=1 Tax=Streptomyces sp. NPDC052020 TaxID=3155677 RepID=UPI00343A5543
METSLAYWKMVETWKQYRDSGKSDTPRSHVLIDGRRYQPGGVNTPCEHGLPIAAVDFDSWWPLDEVLAWLMEGWINSSPYVPYGCSENPPTCIYAGEGKYYEIASITLDSEGRVVIQAGEMLQ